MPKLVSPNAMLQAAEEMMLDGNKAETHEDWAIVMNFFAANVDAESAMPACKLLRAIYDMPLSEVEVKEIVKFQLERR